MIISTENVWEVLTCQLWSNQNAESFTPSPVNQLQERWFVRENQREEWMLAREIVGVLLYARKTQMMVRIIRICVEIHLIFSNFRSLCFGGSCELGIGMWKGKITWSFHKCCALSWLDQAQDGTLNDSFHYESTKIGCELDIYLFSSHLKMPSKYSYFHATNCIIELEKHYIELYV